MTNPISARLTERTASVINSGEMPDALLQEAKYHIDAQDAKIKALTDALKWQSDVIDKAITGNEIGEHRLLLDGEYHKGPVVDWVHTVLTGFSKINRAALAAAKEPT